MVSVSIEASNGWFEIRFHDAHGDVRSPALTSEGVVSLSGPSQRRRRIAPRVMLSTGLAW